MSKTIVTHMNPDLDAVTSVWLIKRFGGVEWEEAEIKYIPAGQTYKGDKVDSDPDILHVDVGMGKLDHHHTKDENLCGATLVFDWLVGRSKQFKKNRALVRLVEVVRNIDWAGHLRLPKASGDIYSFLFFEHGILAGWQKLYRNKSNVHMELSLPVLDGIYEHLKSKVDAEKELRKAARFTTKWGKGVGSENDVFGFSNFAQSKRFPIVVTKNVKTGNVRIHGFSFKKGATIDLTSVWEILKHRDTQATWFLHASKKMLLNGSRANPDMIPTKLSLNEIIEVLKKA